MPSRLVQLAASLLFSHMAEVRNEADKTTLTRSQHVVEREVMHAKIESRTGSVLGDGTDVCLKESASADGVVAVGLARNGETSEYPVISRHARLSPPVRTYSLAFFAALLTSLIVFRVTLFQLASFSSVHPEYSYIPLIPLISAFLISVRRDSIFRHAKPCLWLGGCVLSGAMLLWLAKDHFWIDPATRLEFSSLAVMSTWCGLFLLLYGRHASRAALLPLSLLLFMIPPPDSMLNVVIQFLQQGSAVLSSEMFRLVGVPALREGTVISLPQLTIVVAPECSGIRSSISLLIVTLAVADLYLRSGWNKVLLVLTVVPLVVVKNAIRIVTLSMLGIYVDPGFLDGPLHHRGGILFFLIAVAMLTEIVTVMRWLERRRPAAASSIDDESNGE